MMDRDYRETLGVARLSSKQVGEVLVDLKRRIEGEFRVLEQDDEKIVLVNSACPFGDFVADRPSMCMMTSNVFGVIAAENLGYACVELEETIASGDGRCVVKVHLKERSLPPAAGREYYASSLQDEDA